MIEDARRVICYFYWCILRMNKYESNRESEFISWKAASMVNLLLALVYAPLLLFVYKNYSIYLTNYIFLLVAGIWCGLLALFVYYFAIARFDNYEKEFLALNDLRRNRFDRISLFAVAVIAIWCYAGLTLIA